MSFFNLTVILSLPIWLAGDRVSLMPGLNASALAVVCPAISALANGFRSPGGTLGALRRFDPRHATGPAAFAIALALPIGVTAALYALQSLTGHALPLAGMAPASAASLMALFLVGALLEEVGWTGFATPRLAARLGPVRGGLVIGAAWAAWHWVALVQLGHPPAWIAAWSAGTIAMRVIMVRLVTGGRGRALAAVLFHAVSNLCWQLYPVRGSSWDPGLHALLMTLAAAVIVAWPRRAPVAAT